MELSTLGWDALQRGLDNTVHSEEAVPLFDKAKDSFRDSACAGLIGWGQVGAAWAGRWARLGWYYQGNGGTWRDALCEGVGARGCSRACGRLGGRVEGREAVIGASSGCRVEARKTPACNTVFLKKHSAMRRVLRATGCANSFELRQSLSSYSTHITKHPLRRAHQGGYARPATSLHLASR